MSHTSATRKRKDPAEVRTYYFDFTDDLVEGDSIDTYTVTAETGLTKLSDSRTGAFIGIRLSGGTLGEVYDVVATATTVGGDVIRKTRQIVVKTA